MTDDAQSPGRTAQVELLSALLYETWTTQTASDILLVSYHSPRISDSVVHEAKEKVKELYDD